VGDFKDGKIHGFGSFTYLDQRISTGNWVAGAREGQFTTLWPDGKKLIGNYKKSIIDHGRMEFTNGSWFEGTFVDNKFGKGQYYNKPKDSMYFGQFKENKYDGFGEYETPEFKYKGIWHVGVMEGKGEYEKKVEPKLKYVGDFKLGKFHGFGERVLFTGKEGYNTYKGEFFNHTAHGKGTFFHSDGKRRMVG